MTIKYRAHLPPGVNAPPPARKYPVGPRKPSPPRGSLDELRGRSAAHVARPDAMVIWNGAIGAALDRVAQEPGAPRERVIEILQQTMADVF